MKWYHILLAFILGLLLGAFGYSYWPSPETDVEDPIIHQLREGIAWREFKESKIKDSLKFERKEKMTLAKENIELRAKSEKAIARFNEVRKAVPLTRGDTIRFLVQDTIACDSALLRSRELAAGLTIEIMTDNAIIKNLDSLNSNLNSDKKDLFKMDSLNQIDHKKKVKKSFWKGIKWGAISLAILETLWKAALLLL